MKQAAKEAFEKNIHHYDTVKIIAKDYLSNQECPVEAAMYHILPKLKLRRIFFLVYFLLIAQTFLINQILIAICED